MRGGFEYQTNAVLVKQRRREPTVEEDIKKRSDV